MDHDNHNTIFGHMSPTRIVVLSQALKRDSILDAYQVGSFYASEDWDTKVDFRINGEPLGSQLEATSAVLITATVNNADQGDDVDSLQLWYGKPESDKLQRC